MGSTAFISPVTFNYAPAVVDFFLLFFHNVPPLVTFRFSFLALVSEAYSLRETRAEALAASVAGGCRVVVSGV